MRRLINGRNDRFKLRIAHSAIHRIGVFALEDIPAGQRVIEYTGERLTNSEAMRLEPPNDRYLVCLNKEWVLDGRKKGSGAEFINHSCAPNLTVRRKPGHLFFYSQHKIRAGQALTVRYTYRG